jgi:hypothetical protein
MTDGMRMPAGMRAGAPTVRSLGGGACRARAPAAARRAIPVGIPLAGSRARRGPVE